MQTLEQIRKQLQPMNLSAVAEQSGVSYGALRRMMMPHSKPSYETVRKVSVWLESRA